MKVLFSLFADIIQVIVFPFELEETVADSLSSPSFPYSLTETLESSNAAFCSASKSKSTNPSEKLPAKFIAIICEKSTEPSGKIFAEMSAVSMLKDFACAPADKIITKRKTAKIIFFIQQFRRGYLKIQPTSPATIGSATKTPIIEPKLENAATSKIFVTRFVKKSPTDFSSRRLSKSFTFGVFNFASASAANQPEAR